MNGIVGGIYLLADFTGGGGGFFWGAIGNVVGDLERPEVIRVKPVVYGEDGEGANESDGRAYSSTSDAQYSAARVALLISRRANLLLLLLQEELSGESQVLRGGAIRTLNGIRVRKKDCIDKERRCYILLHYHVLRHLLIGRRST